MGLFIRKECVRDFGIRLALKRSYVSSQKLAHN